MLSLLQEDSVCSLELVEKGDRLLLGDCRVKAALLKESGPSVLRWVYIRLSLLDCSDALRPLLLCAPETV